MNPDEFNYPPTWCKVRLLVPSWIWTVVESSSLSLPHHLTCPINFSQQLFLWWDSTKFFILIFSVYFLIFSSLKNIFSHQFVDLFFSINSTLHRGFFSPPFSSSPNIWHLFVLFLLQIFRYIFQSLKSLTLIWSYLPFIFFNLDLGFQFLLSKIKYPFAPYLPTSLCCGGVLETAAARINPLFFFNWVEWVFEVYLDAKLFVLDVWDSCLQFSVKSYFQGVW